MLTQRTYYHEVGQETEVFELAWRQRLPLLLKGPTGCGKSRFVEAMAERLGRPLVTVACNEDTTASDLLGRHLILGGDTVWVDGPLTRGVREGAIVYLDEFVEARADTLVVIHALTDHRRCLYLDRLDQTVMAPDSFMLVVSYNPGYQHGLKELKPSTRQRFLAHSFDYPGADDEAEIVSAEAGVRPDVARRLVKLAHKIRNLHHLGLSEAPSTRLLVSAAKLIAAGLAPRQACRTAVVEALSDDPEIISTLQDLADLLF
ncbi:CbbQ/NirQ/NorQ/GpvN family protein [bacterium]|nr:CbbQ/NirQ/NorQ/GpvN family protein [bacterium]